MQGMNNGNAASIDDMVRNGGFYCDICGQDDLVPSTITLAASYGSTHDGERVTLMVCGDCMDWLFDSIAEHGEKPRRITSW